MGTFGSISAILTTIIGVHFGHVLVHTKVRIVEHEQMVDILGFLNPFRPLEWIGMNAMLVFVMAAEGIFEGFLNGWFYESTNSTLVYWIQKHVCIRVWHSRRVGVLLYVIFAQILFWALVAGVMHRLGIYWKL